MTSAGITGKCPSCISPPRCGCGSRADPGSACGATSDPQAGDGGGEGGRILEALAVLVPARRGPDLGVVPAAQDHRVALETRERPEALRDEDATLAVELRLEGPGEQLPLEQPRVGIRHGQAPDLGRELLPGRHREDRETGVEPPRDHAATVELRAETRRDGDSPLLVDRVPVLAGEHRVPHSPDIERRRGGSSTGGTMPAGPADSPLSTTLRHFWAF